MWSRAYSCTYQSFHSHSANDAAGDSQEQLDDDSNGVWYEWSIALTQRGHSHSECGGSCL